MPHLTENSTSKHEREQAAAVPVCYTRPVSNAAKFRIGQLIEHKLFGYRGVVVDVDAEFLLTEEWYAKVAKSQPPKDAPWYHVLPHDARHLTYVAERNLMPDDSGQPVNNPLVEEFFDRFADGEYIRERTVN